MCSCCWRLCVCARDLSKTRGCPKPSLTIQINKELPKLEQPVLPQEGSNVKGLVCGDVCGQLKEARGWDSGMWVKLEQGAARARLGWNWVAKSKDLDCTGLGYQGLHCAGTGLDWADPAHGKIISSESVLLYLIAALLFLKFICNHFHLSFSQISQKPWDGWVGK